MLEQPKARAPPFYCTNFSKCARHLSGRKILLGNNQSARHNNTRSLKAMDGLSIKSQSGVRELRENRRRLRHCNGLQTPTGHCENAGRRERGHTRSQDIGLVVLVAGGEFFSGQLLRKEKDEARLLVCFRQRVNDFIAPSFLCGERRRCRFYSGGDLPPRAGLSIVNPSASCGN